MSKFDEISVFVKNLISEPLTCDKSILELTSYKDTDFWWYAQFDLIDALLRLSQKEKPKEPAIHRFLRLSPLILLILSNFIFDCFRKALCLATALIFRQNKDSTENPKILFTSQDQVWQSLYDYESGKTIQTDIFFHTLIKQNKKSNQYEFIATYPAIKYILPIRNIFKAIRFIAQRLSKWAIGFYPLNSYWNHSVAYNEYRAMCFFKKQWQRIENDPKFRELCIYEEDNLYNFLAPKLKFYFLVLFPYAVKRIEMSRRLINKHRPVAVLATNEYGIFERSLIIASKYKCIPTAAIQHGEITPSHQGYMYVKTMIQKTSARQNQYMQLPDKTFVWGQHYKSLLKSAGYPEDFLEITGSSKYDEIADIRNSKDKQALLNRYNLDTKGRTIILWTTQCLGLTTEENIANFDAVRALAEALDVLVLVKQHPREQEVYDRMINEHLLGPGNIQLLPKNSHTLSLINVSDIVISKFSTTALEALAFDKNLIIMNLTNEPDKVSYVRDGVAIGAYSRQGLIDAVRLLTVEKNHLKDKRENYIERFLFKVDGNSAKRVLDGLARMINT